MKFKARPDLPPSLLAALKHDSYEEALSDHFEELPLETKAKYRHTISTTTLSRSPRQRILFNRHADEIEVDPEDRFWAILGRVVNSILDEHHGPHEVIRQRLGIVVPVVLKSADKSKGRPAMKVDVYLHGELDLYDPLDERIDYWKFTKAESMYYSKEDHEAQLNVLAFIWNKHKLPVKKLRNIYLFRNWERRFVKEEGPYPKGRVYVKDVDLWPEERTLEYINKRLFAHFANEGFSDDDLAPCTDAERWMSDPVYKVYKVDEKTLEPQKVAKHTADSMTEAQDKVEELKAEDWAKTLEKNNSLKKPKPEEELPRTTYTVKELKAAPMRCSFCECLSFCNVRREELIAQSDPFSIQSTEEVQMPE